MEINLTPRAFEAVKHEFDVKRGYARHRQGARDVFRRRSALRETDLTATGVIKRSVFTAAECAEARERIKNGLGDAFDRDAAVATLARIFSDDIDREIISYFESEYVPLDAGFLEVRPDEPESLTDGWHCGEGPSRFLRLIVSFTGSEADGPATLFSDRIASDRLKEVGYVHCEARYRLKALDGLTDALGMERAPVVALEVAPGDVIVFDSPNILHRRLLPESSPRYLMAATLIPSASPWREVIDAGTFPLPQGSGFPPLPGYATDD